MIEVGPGKAHRTHGKHKRKTLSVPLHRGRNHPDPDFYYHGFENLRNIIRK
jgi:hypothetical protein